MSSAQTQQHFADFVLNIRNRDGLQRYLSENERLFDNEQVENLKKAGEGNMNCVLRVSTNQRSFVLKQSRPWVEKFPQVAAPVDRLNKEAWFYEVVRKNEIIRSHTPELLWFDQQNYLLAMEDLGVSSDYTSIYQKGVTLGKIDMLDIAKVVSELHYRFNETSLKERIQNRAMRELNHQHIFVLPLMESNGFDLDSVMKGLQEKTEKFRNDTRLKKVAEQLGDIYVNQKGRKLIHGDYYPGSWLKTANGFRMIDPEFCFFGPPEFELAVAVAHLKMAEQSDSLIKDLFVYYHFDEKFDGSLFTKFAGMEIIRRIIGLAQLPLDLNLKERLELLDNAYEFVVNG